MLIILEHVLFGEGQKFFITSMLVAPVIFTQKFVINFATYAGVYVVLDRLIANLLLVL